ncbi:Ankyrin repeat [Fusarium oxysporum f. sp. vasinfectum]|nr:Ankyrin repeat [Fusarium oxysporum f. sp. vasinfectum]KAK2931443.1 Ankyrin repeat [Fusarium oxysporum f. sp. vasinfectum]
MAEVSLAIKAADGGVHDKDATVPEDPGNEIACHSDSNSSSSHEGDESDEPEPPALHKKLLAIAEAGQPTKPATSEDFNSLLVEKRSEINAQDSTGKTALHVAIEHGLDAEAQTLIQNEADIGIGDNEGQQPLYHACVEGNTELVKLLLSKSAIVNAASNNGETPLAAACRNGHTEIVNILLDEKANTKTADEEKWTPLHWASWENHKEIVKRLLDEDTSNINAIETNENWTPINAAAYRGHEEVVSLLLEENADLYTPDYSNWTPLLTATRMQHPEIVRTILRYKTGWKEDYLEIRDDGGNTPLHVASDKGYYEIASQLVDAGANCNATDGQGMTPLHLASFGNHYKIIALLVLKAPVLGIDIDAKANDGRNSLHLASLQGNELIVKALIQGKVSIDATDDADMTPLHLASGANVADRCLSDPDPVSPSPSGDDGPDWEKRNVEAKSGRHLAVVELLLRNEANPRLKAANGDTALHRAAAIGDNERIDILLKNIKSEDFSWENWKDSPVKSALGGDDPQAAMESLLAKQEVKKAPFWKEGGRNQVMEEAVKCARPRGLLDLIFRELSKDALNPPTGCQDWGSIQWAAHERLPDVLSGLINKSEPIENVDEMSESSCELLVQVMWILITSSERTPKNTDSVKEAYDVVRKNTLPTKHEAANPLSKEEMRIRDKLFKTTADLKEFTGTNRRKNFILTKGSDRLNKVQEKNLFQLENLARNFEGYAGKDTEPHTSHKFKSIAILSTLQDILKDPPFAQISQTHKDKVDYSPPVPAPDHQKIVKEAEATVVGFFKGKSESGRIRRSRSLQEIIYDLGPTDVMDTAIGDLIAMTRSGSMHFNSKLYATENLKLKWVHLPSTNMVWMNAQAAAAGSLKDKQKVYDDWNSDSRDTVKRSHGFVPASAIYMPYLEYSTHCRDWNDTKSGDFKQAHEHYEELLQKYKGKGKQQHGSPTLDEWYYQFSQEDSDAKDNQNTRNESQVVSKYLQERPEIKEASGTRDRNQWTVVRVNQLWIWTISKDWIITATSSPFTNSPDTLVEEVLNQLSKQAEYGGSRAQPVLASELVPVIIDHCIGLYEKRPNDAGRISIGQTFSHYINRIGRNETTLFDDFRALSPDEHHKKNANDKLDGHSPVGKSRETNYQPMAESTAATAISTHGQTRETTQQSHGQDISSAIQKAKDLYCDIKDVRDELNILKSVAQYQQIVQRGLAGKGVDESRFSSTYVVKDVKELDSIAERIQSAINTTLSLQQSEVANRQATEATRQGKTVMTFTFATVLFLPLSFLSSLFALDVASFQEAPAWAFYIIFFVSIGISAILGFSVFYWEDIRHFKKEFMTSPANALEQLFKPASNPSTMPKASDSGNNETGRAIKPLRIVSKMEDWGQKLINRARGHGRKNDIDDIENSSAVLRG